jgi:hypothetical protein
MSDESEPRPDVIVEPRNLLTPGVWQELTDDERGVLEMVAKDWGWERVKSCWQLPIHQYWSVW